jgi:DNA-binding NarL/FixJ family response regulator
LPLVRVLLVEDYKPFQNLIFSILRQRPEWQLIGVASDGAEAVRHAGEQRPDVILLDIGLPRMDGIKAAGQIRAVSPESKIVFVSQETSAAVVRETFRLGAWGYLIKTAVRRELIEAIESVLQNVPFVSAGVNPQDLMDRNQVSERDRRFNYAFAARMNTSADPGNTGRHEVQFYSSDEILLDRATHFIEKAIRGDHSILICARPSFCSDLQEALERRTLNIPDLERSGAYVSLNAEDVISACMVDGEIQPARLLDFFQAPMLTAASAGAAHYPCIAIYSEVGSALWKQGGTTAALGVERICSSLTRTHHVDVLCGYSLSYLHGEEDEFAIQRICAEHNAIYSE